MSPFGHVNSSSSPNGGLRGKGMAQQNQIAELGIDFKELDVLEEEAATGVITSTRQVVYLVLVFIIAMSIWEFLVYIFDYPQYILPRPSDIAISIWGNLVTERILWFHIGYTMTEVMIGFFIGAGIGLILGIWIALSHFAERIFYPYIVALQALPKVAIAPLFVIWLGFGMSSRIGIAATIAMFPVIVNTFIGLRHTDRERILFLRSLSASKWQIFTKVQLPSALPLIFAGLDLAIVLSIIGAIVGELVSGLHGLGSAIMQKNFSLDTAGIFAILLVLAFMGTGLHSIMRWIQKKVVFWSEEQIIVGI